jgi:hypothetical protein
MMNYRLIVAISFLLCLFSPSAIAQSIPPNSEIDSLASPITSVTQLSDVQPTDWAFQALRSLIEQYGCIEGDPNRIFRGHQSLTRFEFAAALNLCLTRLSEQITTDRSKKADLELPRRLQTEFSSELVTLRGRVDALEVRTTTVEKQQFSTTTKLRGIVVMAGNVGGFTGDRIVDIRGNSITNTEPNATLLYRASLILDTSFTGKDLLRILVEAGSEGIGDNATGFLEPTLGSVLDYSAKPPTGNTLGLSRVMYTFNPASNLEVSVGSVITLTDFVDRNRYANKSFQDFSTLAFVNNYVLFPVSGLGAGGAIRWKPGNGAFNINAGYVAVEAQNPGNQGSVRGISPISQTLYPNSRGESGLFGDTHQGVVELEYTPSEAFSLRLQYAGGQVLDNRFDAIGANLEWTLSPQLGIFGRYGYSWYNNTVFGNLNPQYWMAGITLKDLFKSGAFAGLAIGQPFVERTLGTGTQTNIEAFYSLPVNDFIRLSPVVQVITNPSNQSSNGTIVTGTLRTVFSF